MIQDQNPIDPVKRGKLVFGINGNKVSIEVEMIPKLFVAYVAAVRAEYYAGVDDAKNPGCFDEVFREEIRHAMRDRSEITDWMQNNMDIADEPADEIGVAYIREAQYSPPCPGCGVEYGQRHERGCREIGT